MSEEIRCPMCGKPNPADAVVCQHCGARLRPILAGEEPKADGLSEDTPSPEGTTNDLQITSSSETPSPLDDSAVEPELPDWLQAIGDPDTETFAEEDEEEELPDWLKDLGLEHSEEEAPAPQPEAQVEEAEATPEAATPEAEELPDWLDELGGEPAEEAEAIPEAAAPEAETLPDWLDELGGEPAEEAEATPEAATPEAETLPDWLDELGGEPTEEAEATPEAATSEVETLPDWLDELGGEPAEEAEAIPEAAAPEAEELPDWLDELGGEPTEEAKATPEAAASEAEELPDWLETLSPEAEHTMLEDAGEATPPANEADAGLSAGELPSWVEEMRPVEVPLEELGVQEPVEQAGPLRGLRGVLPPASDEAMPKQVVGIASARLSIAPEEEKQIKTLAALLSEEFAPKAAPAKRRKSRGRWLRWLFGLLLLAVAFLPLALPGLRAPLPHKALPSAIAAKQVITHLPQNSVVLVGVDYNLGFSAEMEAAAAPVLAELMDKHARLVTISTQPVGADLATRLIETVLAPTAKYHEGTDYLNLGYLPGGTAALYAFAHSPRSVLPNVGGHASIWQTPFLSKIHSLDDFDLVLLITEDPATMRSWVEQVRPSLSHTPFVVVVSAQAEPLAEPYYETSSHQIGGIISGLEGGVAYDEMSGRHTLPHVWAVWSSYSLVLLVAVALLALAGFYNFVTGLLEANHHRPNDVEE